MARLTASIVVGISVVCLLVVVGGCWLSKAEATKIEEGDKFAEDRNGAGDPVPFDSKRALGYLADICKIGPRISGSEGMKKQQELLQKHFEDKGGKVTLQKFTAKQPGARDSVEMANLIVSWQPEKQRRVIICSHYDTRPIADQEKEKSRWHDAFISANDGGSGVAFLMEMANHMKDLKTNVGVDFVIFDGEEYINDNKNDEYFFGSKHFGAEYRKARAKDRDGKLYLGAILLDMIAGKKPQFPVEQNSWFEASALVKDIYKIAEEQKCTAFKGGEFTDGRWDDDHLPLNKAGIPAIDISDFKYPHWHRLSDVPENCSGEGLEQVSKVVSVWMQRAK